MFASHCMKPRVATAFAIALTSCLAPAPAEHPPSQREAAKKAAAPERADSSRDRAEQAAPVELLEAYPHPERLNSLSKQEYEADPAFHKAHVVECDSDEDCPGASCVVRDSIDCSARDECRELGLCTPVPASRSKERFGERVCSDADVCGAASDDDCRDATICRERGYCTAGTFRQYYLTCPEEPCYTLVHHVCLPTPQSCARSPACAAYGHCGYRDETSWPNCRPMAEVHCAQSEQCRQFGHCGFTQWSSHHCLPTEEEHCRQSEACREEGKCSMNERASGRHFPQETACRASSDEDCQGSRACREEGRCTAELHGCVAS